MAYAPAIKIRHSYATTYLTKAQRNWVGAQTAVKRRGCWNDLQDTEGAVWAQCLVADRYLFYSIANGTSSKLKKRDILLGVTTTVATLNAEAYCIFANSTYLYIGGDFTTVNGTARGRFARFDLATLTLDAANPGADATVVAITGSTTTNGPVYIGGAFANVQSTGRAYLAAIANTGSLDAWNPSADATVSAMAYMTTATTLSGASILVGGQFANAGGAARALVAEIDPAGSATAWDPGVSGGLGYVAVLAVNETAQRIYIGGGFTTVAAATRNLLAEVDYSGAVTTLDPNCTTAATKQVATIQLDAANGYIYFGGDFTAVGGVTRAGAAKIRLSDGRLDAWAPPLTLGSGAVRSLSTFQRTIYVGGDYTAVGACYPVGIGADYGASMNSFPDPLFTDANTLFVSKATGADTNPGTYAAPLKTIMGDPLTETLGALGTVESLADISGAGNTLTGGKRPVREGLVTPKKGNFCGGPFATVNEYFIVPAAVGAAITASNAFRVECFVWWNNNYANSCLWYLAEAATGSYVTVAANGAVSFTVRGTTATSAAGVIQTDRWHKIEFSYDGTTHDKILKVDGVTVITASQTTTYGAITAHNIGSYIALSATFWPGYIDDFKIYSTSSATTLEGWWPFETLSAARTAAAQYVCVIDSEDYNEIVRLNDDNVELWALDGQAPSIKPRAGVVAGTYGARKTGRIFSSGVADANTLFVSKSGNDATGARGSRTLPFLTVQAALNDGSRASGDRILFLDSGTYIEDLDASTMSVDLEADSGQIPTLVNINRSATAQLFSIDAGLLARFYGLNIVLQGGSTGAFYGGDDTGTYFARDKASIEMHDCTISGGSYAFAAFNTGGAGSTYSKFKSCLFINQSTAALLPTATSSGLYNCYVSNCEFKSGRGNGIQTSASRMPSLKVVGCSFATPGGYGIYSPGGAEYVDVYKNLFSACKGGVYYAQTGAAAYAIQISWCFFDRCGNGNGTYCAAYINHTTFTPERAIYLCIDHCVSNGCKNTVLDLAIQHLVGTIAGNLPYGNTSGICDCVSISSAGSGIAVWNDNTYTGVNWQLRRNLAVNAAGNGFTVTNNFLRCYFSSCVEANSLGSYGFYSNVAVTAIDSITEKGVSGFVLGGGSLQADPLLASDVDGAENCSFVPPSEVLGWHDDADRMSGGPCAPAVSIRGDWCRLDGFIVDPYFPNLGSGVCVEGLLTGATRIAYCTIKDAYFSGVLLGSEAKIEKCRFDQCLGNGVIICRENCVVEFSSFEGLAGAGIVQAGANTKIKNVSTWACLYGQWDRAPSAGELQNNVMADSGAYDYSGQLEQTYADIETVGDGGTVDANSVQLSPLFADPVGGDLLLQSLAGGFPFDSPALARGNDGRDAGCMHVERGAGTVSYTEISMATSGYFNPDVLIYKSEPQKLAEGTSDAGSPYSKAVAYKDMYEMRWNSTNPMPAAQLAALKALYEADSEEVQISLDDSTWLTCVLIKSVGFEYQELTGLHTDNSNPKPVASLVFMEK